MADIVLEYELEGHAIHQTIATNAYGSNIVDNKMLNTDGTLAGQIFTSKDETDVGGLGGVVHADHKGGICRQLL